MEESGRENRVTPALSSLPDQPALLPDTVHKDPARLKRTFRKGNIGNHLPPRLP